MSDDFEKHVRRLSPRAAPTALRRQVLGTVAGELHRANIRRRDRRIVVAIAISLFVAVAANYVIAARQDAALAGLYGPTPESRQIGQVVDMVLAVTDAKTAAYVRARLERAVGKPDPAETLAAVKYYHETICRMATSAMEIPYEQKKNRSEVGRDRAGNPDRGLPTTQRAVGLEIRFTA